MKSTPRATYYHSEDEVYNILASQNEYNSVWANLKPGHRLKQLKQLRKQIARRAESLAEQISEYTRRPAFEVMTQEILPVLEMARYCNRKMPRWLRSRHKRYLRPGFFGSRETLSFEPYGTVAVITPSNFPFSLGMMSTFYLAAAGNTVVWKPSEQFPEIAELVRQLVRDSGLGNRVIGIVEGTPDVANTIIDSGSIQKVFFFGRKDSGEEIRRRCYERNIPSVLETGGGTAALVDTDVQIKRTAAGIAWSALYTRGHSCIGTRFVYVKRKIKDLFLKELLDEVGRTTGEYNLAFSLSTDTTGKVRSAVDRGAILYPLDELVDSSHKVTTVKVKSCILEVYPDDPILQQELYDPVLVLCAVDRMSEAVNSINRSGNCIGVSVWTTDKKRARALICQLNAPMNWINDASVGLPNLPWGSWNFSSQGSIFSKEALYEAGNWKWTIESPARIKRFWWYPYTNFKKQLSKLLTRFY